MVDYQRAVRRAIAMWGTHTPKKTQNKYKDKRDPSHGIRDRLRTELGGAEPAADGLTAGGVVADDFDGGGDGNGQDETDAAPQEAPEEKRDSDGEGVKVNAAADHGGK